MDVFKALSFFNKVNPFIAVSKSSNRLDSLSGTVEPEVVAHSRGASIKNVSNSKPLDSNTVLSGISLGVRVVHWVGYLLNSSSGASGNSFAGEVGPALSIIRSNLG